MTYSDLYQLCQRQSGNRTADALEGFKLYLNLAQKDLAGRYEDWPELRSASTLALTDGTEGYALASDFYKMRPDTMRITTANKERLIQEIPYAVFRTQYQNTSDDTEDEPRYWYYAPNDVDTVRFYPIPDQSYTAAYDYSKVPSDMSAVSDTPFIAARWHHVLVDFALAMHYESSYEARFDKATYHRTRYENEVEKVIVDARMRSIGADGLNIDYGTGVNESAGEETPRYR